MAKAKPVVSDQNSLEVDEMRRSMHNLMLVLENIASQVDGTDVTAVHAFEALAHALETGVDDGSAGTYTGTGLKVAGVKPTPLHPRRARVQKSLADLTASSDY